MAFSFATNVPSLMAQRYLSLNQTGLSQSLNRLSSGFRINSAADDAAGLGISQSLRAQIRSYAQAERNTNVGISMAETAESSASEISDIIIRMRELGVQAANGDLTSTDRSLLDTEYQELVTEIDRLADATEFNGSELLAGALNTISFQVGIDASSNSQIDVGFGGVSVSNLGLSGTLLTGSAATNATAAITALDSALSSISLTQSRLGAAVNRLTFAVENNEATRTNLEAANSAIRDTDVATETANLARYQVLLQAGVSVLATANQVPTLALSFLSSS